MQVSHRIDVVNRRHQMKDESLSGMYRQWNNTHQTVTRYLWTPAHELQQRRASAADKLHLLIA
jgi:hypothetical protein